MNMDKREVYINMILEWAEGNNSDDADGEYGTIPNVLGPNPIAHVPHVLGTKLDKSHHAANNNIIRFSSFALDDSSCKKKKRRRKKKER